MILKLIAEIEVEIDGKLSKEKAIEILQTNCMPEGVVSEDYDGTEDWAILINSWSVREGIS